MQQLVDDYSFSQIKLENKIFYTKLLVNQNKIIDVFIVKLLL